MAHTLLTLVMTVGLLGAPDAGAQHAHGQHGPGDAAGTSTLTADDVRQLLDGDGAGMAKAAELHGYPGPKHILERAAHLTLTPAQHEAVTAIRSRMLAEAQRLGREIVEQERALDAAFEAKSITPEDLAARLRRIGALRADLRAAHLAAHLEAVTVLTPEQVQAYYQLGAHGSHGK
jgi:Spy/CpxP family protein refolding chaperone